MNRSQRNDSRATFVGGRNGMVVGASAGALLFAIGTVAMDMFDVGAGGPGLAVMAGAALGGLAGTLFGALKARPGGNGNFAGTDRRHDRSPYAGSERRAAHWYASH